VATRVAEARRRPVANVAATALGKTTAALAARDQASGSHQRAKTCPANIRT
jgi:hypothetical protein